MTLAHEAHAASTGSWLDLLPVAATVALLAGYTELSRRRGRSARAWSRWRTVSFTGGCLLLLVAFLPPLSAWAAADMRGHMLQHLLVGMVASLGLALGAPVTLLLGAVRPATGRRLTAVLRSRLARRLAHPGTALTLTLGGLVLLYFTPLYDAATTRPALHAAVHLHFLLSGFLFAWVIAGSDPAPHRAGVGLRIAVLGVAVIGHATISQLMYAGIGVQVTAPHEQVQGAAAIMYFGGDAAEILLALAMLSGWRARGARARGARAVVGGDGVPRLHAAPQ